MNIKFWLELPKSIITIFPNTLLSNPRPSSHPPSLSQLNMQIAESLLKSSKNIIQIEQNIKSEIGKIEK